MKLKVLIKNYSESVEGYTIQAKITFIPEGIIDKLLLTAEKTSDLHFFIPRQYGLPYISNTIVTGNYSHIITFKHIEEVFHIYWESYIKDLAKDGATDEIKKHAKTVLDAEDRKKSKNLLGKKNFEEIISELEETLHELQNNSDEKNNDEQNVNDLKNELFKKLDEYF